MNFGKFQKIKLDVSKACILFDCSPIFLLLMSIDSSHSGLSADIKHYFVTLNDRF